MVSYIVQLSLVGNLDWMDKTGSFIAGVAALFVLLYEAVTGGFRRSAAKKAAKEQAKEIRNAQASQVTWWLEDDDGSRSIRRYADSANPDYSEGGSAVLVIQNANSAPMYYGEIKFPNTLSTSWEGTTGPPEVYNRQLGTLAPGITAFKVPKSIMRSPTQISRHQADVALGLLVEWLEFRDGNQVIWRRGRNGKLIDLLPMKASDETMHSM